MSKENVPWQQGKVTEEDRGRLFRQKGLVVWFTGLSGSGKTTIATEVERLLIQQGRAVYRLDGDNLRHGLNADLGFTEADRNENVRRVAEVAALFRDAGLIALVALISPYRRGREFARLRAGDDAFIEVYVQADLETCRRRDPKGLYKKAMNGEIPGFTGISDPYESPLNPDLTLDTTQLTIPEAVRRVIQKINKICWEAGHDE
ncbi:MAG TPA: adenylyl-sulfate kinase [Bacillota bacterium]|nr:adenylyl-sulfate kinase [Bacillota bacterium]